MATNTRITLEFIAVAIVIVLLFLSLRGCFVTPEIPKPFYVEVPVTLPGHTFTIHDTTKGKTRFIETVIPFDLTDTLKIKQLLFSLDSIQKLLVAKNVDRLETYDTTFSAYNDTIQDNLHLEYYLLTSRKSITLDVKQREFKRVIEQVPIQIKKDTWIEQLISDYPLAAVGIGAIGGFILGNR
jgi:hypothetical protein